MDDKSFKQGTGVLLAALVNGGDRALDLAAELFNGEHEKSDLKFVAETAAELYLLSGLATAEDYRDMLVSRIEAGVDGRDSTMDCLALDWLRDKHPELF